MAKVPYMFATCEQVDANWWVVCKEVTVDRFARAVTDILVVTVIGLDTVRGPVQNSCI